MSVVGTAVILGLLVVMLLRMKIARFSVVAGLCAVRAGARRDADRGQRQPGTDLARGLGVASAGAAVRALGSTRLDRQPVRIVEESVRISVWAVLGAWLAASVVPAAGLAGSHSGRADHHGSGRGRRLRLAAGPSGGRVGAGRPVDGRCWGCGWRSGRPRSTAGVWFRVRACWRAAVIYRWRWSTAITGAGLDRKRHDTEYLPQLLRVRSTRSVDRVRVRMLPGQTLDDYAAVADRLAQTFGTLDCRVRSVPRRVHELELWLLIADPLAADRRAVRPRPGTARLRGCRWRWRRTARCGGCSCSAPTCWSSARPGPGKGR